MGCQASNSAGFNNNNDDWSRTTIKTKNGSSSTRTTTTAFPFSFPVEYPDHPNGKGENIHHVSEYNEDDGIYYFNIMKKMIWQGSKSLQGSLSTEHLLFSLPPLCAKIKRLELTFSTSTFTFTGNRPRKCFLLVLTNHHTGLEKQMIIESFLIQDYHEKFILDLDQNNEMIRAAEIGSRFKIILRVIYPLGEGMKRSPASYDLSIGSFEVAIEGQNEAPPVRLPFEEYYLPPNLFVLKSPRPWWWQRGTSKPTCWVSCPPLNTSIENLQCSGDLELLQVSNLKRFVLDIACVRQGTVIASEVVFEYVGSNASKPSIKKHLEVNLTSSSSLLSSSSSFSSIRAPELSSSSSSFSELPGGSKGKSTKLISSCQEGDYLVVRRFIQANGPVQILLRAFQLQLTSEKKTSPCCHPHRLLHGNKTCIMDGNASQCASSRASTKSLSEVSRSSYSSSTGLGICPSYGTSSMDSPHTAAVTERSLTLSFDMDEREGILCGSALDEDPWASFHLSDRYSDGDYFHRGDLEVPTGYQDSASIISV
eukprot:scaffold2621_cov164-Ochromonas_danica.AAC.8